MESQSVNGGVTQSGVTLGTFDYISPEQALDPRQADVRSDLYSMGCTFYHALTGRPPVPEGTAAKKLHAHQHVDPLDPRELNPAIPDELAAVLARMMAKDPARRYQTPAELIAHLKAIAERLHIALDNVANDATVQAVVANDRVLPRVPRLRLGWVAASAAVVAAVVAIAVAAIGPDFAPSPWWAGGPKTDGTPGAADPIPNPVTPRTPSDDQKVSTVEQLAAALADPKSTKVVLAPGEYDLTKWNKPIAFQGSQLELIGSVNPPTTIRLAASSAKRVESPGTLTIQAATVIVRGIRFEIAPAAETGELAGDLTGLAIIDAAKVELHDCTFVPDEGARKAWVAAVAASGSVHLTRCLFAPGWVGLRVPSRSSVEVTDSGFAPHASAIQVRDDDANAEDASDSKFRNTSIRLDRSSFMLDAFSAAVDVDASSTLDVRVTAGHCVFAPANGAPPEAKAPGMTETPPLGTIVRNSANKTRMAKLIAAVDRKNAYYGVSAMMPGMKGSAFEESGWSKLNRRPWDQSGGVMDAFATAEPWAAFRLTLAGPGADSAVFLKGDKLGVIGAQFHVQENLRRAYIGANVTWPPIAPAAVEITTRIWWPTGPADDKDRNPDEYTNLVKLLQDARSGDTILIRHDGVLRMEQHVISPPKPKLGGADRGDFHLLFKPETKDHKPILALAESSIRDRSLFQVVEGRVSFEGLHFALKPGSSQDKLAAVTLVAGRGCEFLGCTFTLEEDEGQTCTAIALTDPNSVMKMDGSAALSIPSVKFTGCLIRGKGRAVSVPVSRPFALEMTQCVTGLNGPVVFAKAGGREIAAMPGSTIHLTRVTAFLGGPLVELQGGSFGAMKASGLVTTTVTAERCLFAAVPGSGPPMVEVEGTELDRNDSNRVLKWTSPGPNHFANFDPSWPVVVVKPDPSSTQEWKWNEWLQFAKEAGKLVGKVEFENEPDDLKDLLNLMSGDVKVKSVALQDMPDAKPGDAGADPDRVANPPDAGKK